MQSQIRHSLARLLLVLAVGFHTAEASMGVQPQTPPTGIIMASEPLRLEGIGLTLSVPQESTINTVQIENQQVRRIEAASWPWFIDIRTPKSSNLKTTTTDAADSIIKELLDKVGILDGAGNVISTRGKVKERTAGLTIGGEIGDRFYLQLPSLESNKNVIRGFTIFRPTPGQFVIISIITNEEDLPRARLIYETIIASAIWADAAAATPQRLMPIQTGIRVFQDLTPDDYDAVMEAVNDTWYRLYQPGIKDAAIPDKEQGYKRVRAHKGHRGDLDPAKPKSKWIQSDHQEGYIVQIDSRTLYLDSWVDSQAIFFMSTDRTNEAWIVKNKVQNGKNNNVITEIGARANQNLSIQRKLDGKLTASGQLQTPETGYLSQVECYLLPQLLLSRKLPGEYGFYSYRMLEKPTVRYRSEHLEQPPRGGNWKLISSLDEGQPPQNAFYSSQGVLIRADRLSDSLRWEPIPYDMLLYLWKSKGLPTK